ncbi:hypothetical protein JOQ06_019379 [Pogonophryne albipinna]|uniref:Uncharacterized protein n=1 Tax=Pogonophryne albipinna TaxID=1090488 RepID=A0AAD6FDZ0_9TELE|nr:hypothetical protein JOQ06_019379 [Pogonophryne albipinna]
MEFLITALQVWYFLSDASHRQADMTKPAAALTWWVSACGGSINKHYHSSRTSNRAGPPGGTRGEVPTFYGCCV